jgi:type IV secretory pathway ATPase VirB11/archaellum biosynthesis ATPase
MGNVDEAEDLAINSSAEVFIDHRGDLASVSGRDAFEQELAIRLQEKYDDVIGDLSPAQVAKVLETEASRVAGEMDMLSNVSTFDAARDEDVPNRLNVMIVYNTGDEELFEVD